MTPVPGGAVVAWAYANAACLLLRPGFPCHRCAEKLARELGPILKRLMDECGRKV